MRFLPLVGVMTLIFLLSHTQGKNMPEALYGLDKLCHAMAYATLAAAALWAWLPTIKKQPRSGLLLIFFFCLLYGISDEFHQSFIPGRSPSLADIIADVSGATFILLLWWVWLNKQKKRRTER